MTHTNSPADLKVRLHLIAAWKKPGGKTPAEKMPNIHAACLEAAEALDAMDRAIAGLEAALKECVAVMGETLDKDFGFWSSPAQDDRRSRFYPAWKAGLEALKGQTP